MNRPKMIMFDYGHTLLYELDTDFLRGEKEVWKHVRKNPNQVTAEYAFQFGMDVFGKYDSCRMQGFELHEWQTLRFKYDNTQKSAVNKTMGNKIGGK